MRAALALAVAAACLAVAAGIQTAPVPWSAATRARAVRMALYSRALRCKWVRVATWSCVDCKTLIGTRLLGEWRSQQEYDDAADAFTVRWRVSATRGGHCRWLVAPAAGARVHMCGSTAPSAASHPVALHRSITTRWRKPSWSRSAQPMCVPAEVVGGAGVAETVQLPRSQSVHWEVLQHSSACPPALTAIRPSPHPQGNSAGW